MAESVLLIREGTRLAAADPLSLEVIEGIKAGEYVTATLVRPRNGAHHRKLWALISVVTQAQDLFATSEDLLDALKLATGYFTTGKTVQGIPFAKPKSIAFSSMAQSEFEVFYDKAIAIILETILPGVGRADLDAQVLDIIQGKRA